MSIREFQSDTDAQTEDDNPHTDVFENPAWGWYENPKRFVHNRAAFIDQTTDYDELDAHIIAWSEIGYTVSGMTDYLDVTQSTVKDHCEDIDAVDETARWSRWPKHICVESPVGQTGTVWEGDE